MSSGVRCRGLDQVWRSSLLTYEDFLVACGIRSRSSSCSTPFDSAWPILDGSRSASHVWIGQQAIASTSPSIKRAGAYGKYLVTTKRRVFAAWEVCSDHYLEALGADHQPRTTRCGDHVLCRQRAQATNSVSTTFGSLNTHSQRLMQQGDGTSQIAVDTQFEKTVLGGSPEHDDVVVLSELGLVPYA